MSTSLKNHYKDNVKLWPDWMSQIEPGDLLIYQGNPETRSSVHTIHYITCDENCYFSSQRCGHDKSKKINIGDSVLFLRWVDLPFETVLEYFLHPAGLVLHEGKTAILSGYLYDGRFEVVR